VIARGAREVMESAVIVATIAGVIVARGDREARTPIGEVRADRVVRARAMATVGVGLVAMVMDRVVIVDRVSHLLLSFPPVPSRAGSSQAAPIAMRFSLVSPRPIGRWPSECFRAGFRQSAKR
jgi:hypothetical protein